LDENAFSREVLGILVSFDWRLTGRDDDAIADVAWVEEEEIIELEEESALQVLPQSTAIACIEVHRAPYADC
jgi:hypothetical protein